MGKEGEVNFPLRHRRREAVGEAFAEEPPTGILPGSVPPGVARAEAFVAFTSTPYVLSLEIGIMMLGRALGRKSAPALRLAKTRTQAKDRTIH